MTALAPLDEEISIEQLTDDPYPVYKRLRTDTPVLRVKAVGRTLLTRAADTKYVKDNPELFSSNDPNTPMERAFLAHTLMRKDGEAHLRERNAMAPTFLPRNIRDIWLPLYAKIAEDFVAALPRGETIDLFPGLAGPFAARCLSHLLGIESASDEEMQRWSQTLIDGAGNFGWQQELFDASDSANEEMNNCFDDMIMHHKTAPNPALLPRWSMQTIQSRCHRLDQISKSPLAVASTSLVMRY